MAKARRVKAGGGRWLVRLVLLAGILILGRSVLSRAAHLANVRADVKVASAEALKLYDAFDRFHKRNLAFPASYHGRPFETDTLDPLRRRGYYQGFLTTKLLDHRVDAYDSPDDRGIDQEFWVEMTLGRDDSIRFLVVRSDDAPMSAGNWLEGAYIFQDNELERIE